MIHYIVIKQGEEVGFISIDDFRFYHPKRKRMFMTSQLREAQYIIFEGEYYRVPWLNAEPAEIKGKYPEINLVLISQEEYEKVKSIEK